MFSIKIKQMFFEEIKKLIPVSSTENYTLFQEYDESYLDEIKSKIRIQEWNGMKYCWFRYKNIPKEDEYIKYLLKTSLVNFRFKPFPYETYEKLYFELSWDSTEQIDNKLQKIAAKIVRQNKKGYYHCFFQFKTKNALKIIQKILITKLFAAKNGLKSHGKI